MARILLELTNRCNLRCAHCYDERHAASGDLSFAVIERILAEGHSCGIDHIVFTGGEPTVHREFADIVQCVAAAGYGFSFVSNGTTFPKICALLHNHHNTFRGVTFSLDGAQAATHDQIRGRGSYRQVMRAATLCVFRKLRFTINMVVTAHNRQEISEMVQLGAKLGSSGVRFGHLMPSTEMAAGDLDLSPKQRREVEAEIWKQQETAAIPVGMGPGYYTESPFFPCAPLELDEYNVDYDGNMTLCCQLSGFAGRNSGHDVVGNLHDMSLADAQASFARRVRKYLADKREKVRKGMLAELDHFPCWYCVKYMSKIAPSDDPDVGWLQPTHSSRVNVVLK